MYLGRMSVKKTITACTEKGSKRIQTHDPINTKSPPITIKNPIIVSTGIGSNNSSTFSTNTAQDLGLFVH